MDDDLTIAKARKSLKKKEFSSVELAKYYLNRIEKHKSLNAYITVDSEMVLNSAKRADELLDKKDEKSLTGIPIAVKDIFCTKGLRTTAASKMLTDFVQEYESTVTQNLLNNGAIF
ncbi:MAG: Asp-tRNA(Asn)/Glu-tRNA(Gln) amidotransferase subunit GatA, partial [Holosporales bacterium]|nr:Asp-tRNA(Asn)/Glu-tRNA(Gln) amidotransferase subunit GatA [Holosporales bacterium]